MTDNPPAMSPREDLAVQLAQLERFIAESESRGEELPPQAVEMIARLREIVSALDGLSTSFDPPTSEPA